MPGRVQTRGFSIIDLLVSIAVMAILISLLLPALTNVRETARRVICQGQAQQIGASIQMYSHDYRGKMPYSCRFVEDDSRQATLHRRNSGLPVMLAADTMMSRVMAEGSSSSRSNEPAYKWDGLGILVADKYLSHHAACYCPSHRGNHHLESYTEEWSLRERGTISVNYQYRVPAETSVLDELPPWTTILTDGLETKSDYSHVVGGTVLRADSSVSWYEDEGQVLYDSLPDTAPTDVGTGSGGRRGGDDDSWKRIDEYQSRNRGRR